MLVLVLVLVCLQVHRIEALKAFGANGWRTAHNPHAPALLDAADRTGFLMWCVWAALTPPSLSPLSAALHSLRCTIASGLRKIDPQL